LISPDKLDKPLSLRRDRSRGQWAAQNSMSGSFILVLFANETTLHTVFVEYVVSSQHCEKDRGYALVFDAPRSAALTTAAVPRIPHPPARASVPTLGWARNSGAGVAPKSLPAQATGACGRMCGRAGGKSRRMGDSYPKSVDDLWTA
jgi:hypothetical protein